MDGFDWPERQPTLTGVTLVLRPWSGADADDVFRACQDSDIQRYTTVPVPYSRDHAEHFVSVAAPSGYQQRTAAGFAVTDATTGEVLGACGLAAIDVEARTSGAGYWVAPWARGRGVAAAALEIVTVWGLQPNRLRRIRLEVEPENAPSAAAAVRAGYIRLDGLPLLETHRGALRPFDLFERTSSE